MERQIITLCGSTKFKPEFEIVNRQLTMQGVIVLSCGVFSQSDNIEITQGEKEELDKLHRDKILMSNKVIVIVKGNYIGNSTMREIEYASRHGKVIDIFNFE